MTMDELYDELMKYPGGTKVEDITIYGMPLSSFKLIDENDDEIPLFEAAGSGFKISDTAVKVLDRNRRPDPIN